MTLEDHFDTFWKSVRRDFHYDAYSGVLVRLNGTGVQGFKPVLNREIKGKTKSGYCRVSYKNKRYYLHRFIWFYMTGEWPERQLDHVDGDRANNRFKNLRQATQKENCRNIGLKVNNTSGYMGVYRRSDGKKWCAGLKVNGKEVYLGSFDSKEQARDARKAADKKYGYHENHGERDSVRNETFK